MLNYYSTIHSRQAWSQWSNAVEIYGIYILWNTYCSVLYKKEISLFVTTWVNQEDIV